MNTSLCYLERDGRWLLLHRTKKQHDPNAGKWIGVGGKFEPGESPDDCVCREVREETGLVLTRWQFRGIVTFVSDTWPTEYMHLFTADGFSGEMRADCPEGPLAWVEQDKVEQLPLWEGDRVFLRLLRRRERFFSLKLVYEGDALTGAVLDGRPLEV